MKLPILLVCCVAVLVGACGGASESADHPGRNHLIGAELPKRSSPRLVPQQGEHPRLSGRINSFGVRDLHRDGVFLQEVAGGRIAVQKAVGSSTVTLAEVAGSEANIGHLSSRSDDDLVVGGGADGDGLFEVRSAVPTELTARLRAALASGSPSSPSFRVNAADIDVDGIIAVIVTTFQPQRVELCLLRPRGGDQCELLDVSAMGIGGTADVGGGELMLIGGWPEVVIETGQVHAILGGQLFLRDTRGGWKLLSGGTRAQGLFGLAGGRVGYLLDIFHSTKTTFDLHLRDHEGTEMVFENVAPVVLGHEGCGLWLLADDWGMPTYCAEPNQYDDCEPGAPWAQKVVSRVGVDGSRVEVGHLDTSEYVPTAVTLSDGTLLIDLPDGEFVSVPTPECPPPVVR